MLAIPAENFPELIIQKMQLRCKQRKTDPHRLVLPQLTEAISEERTKKKLISYIGLMVVLIRPLGCNKAETS